MVIYTETYGLGGSERFLVDLADQLAPERFTVVFAGNANTSLDRLLAARRPDLLPRALLEVSATRVGDAAREPDHPPVSGTSRLIQHLRPLLRRRDGAEAGQLDDVLLAPLRYAQAARNLYRLQSLFAELAPDVLLVNNGSYPGGESCRLSPIAARRCGVPHIVNFIHGYAEPPAWPHWVERRLDRWVDACTDIWVSAAHGSSRALAERIGLEPGRVRTVYLAQDAATPELERDASALRAGWGIPPGRSVIAAVAGLVEGKGHEHLLRALARLLAVGLDLHLLLAGSGRHGVRLQSLAAELNIEERTTFLGWVEHPEQVLAAADLLVHPSDGTELLPYSIKEAMALGVPVVATAVGGVPELVADHVTGLLVPPADEAALADAIAEVLAAPDVARQRASAARQRILDEFSADQMLSRMTEILRPPTRR